MRLWRSLLFVPANQKRMLDKLGSLPADGFIFDLGIICVFIRKFIELNLGIICTFIILSLEHIG